MRKYILFAAIILLLLQFSCSPKSSANFELYLTDAPMPELLHVYVTINAIYLRSEDRQTWTDNILTEPKKLEILKLRGREEKLAALELPEGTYSGIKLDISQVEINTTERTYTITMDPPVTVMIPCHFTILPKSTVQVTLDLDAEKSVSWNGARYNFSPFIIVKKIIHR